MFHSARVLSVGLLPWFIACSVSTPPTTPPRGQERGQERILPLVRVRLYASGVGYFERYGDVSSGQSTLPVPSGHLDDALKSLVLLSAGSEPPSLSFPSRVSPAVARARAGMAAAENAALSYDRLLAALRGEEVEVTLANALRLGTTQLKGRVVEVVSVEPSHPSYDHGPVGTRVPKADSAEQEAKEQESLQEVSRLQLILLSEEKGLIRFDTSELVSVRPLERRILERFEAALSARMASRANPTEWLQMAGGKRALKDLRLGYLAETPIWRTSYRLRIEAQGKAELQAWALVHNDTDEVWQGVKLELVDGYPSSFLYPLAAPRYERRELSNPASELSSVPQLSTSTPDAMWGDFSDYQGEVVEKISGPSTDDGAGVGSGQGFGSGHGRLGGRHTTRAPKVLGGESRSEGTSELIWVGDLAKQAGVISPIDRAVSVYDVSSPLNLLPQHSALLPFLKEGVSAKTLVWFTSFGSPPERAIGITNNTPNTLPEGPMSVFSRGGFLGEAILESLQPGARQFARIGEEADFDLTTPGGKRDVQRRHVDFWNGALRIHSVVTSQERLVFNNRSGSPAEIYVGVGLVSNATMVGSDRLDFDTTTGKPFAVFDVPPGAGKERTVESRQGIALSQPLDKLALEDVDELVRDERLPGDERAILVRARLLLEQRFATLRAQEELEVETQTTSDDLTRLKEATQGVGAKDSKEANTVMMTRLLAGHDELRKLKGKKRALDKELVVRSEALKAVLTELNAFRPKLLEERKRAELAGKSGAQ